ncbi:MAG: hypothetical protein QM765_26145 [Myxococcales bacterium]
MTSRLASTALALALAVGGLVACVEVVPTGRTDGGSGTQVCRDWESVVCACTDGTSGVQSCYSERWSRCSCEPPACTQGEVEWCVCPNGSTGSKTCLWNGTFGACACNAPDAGPGPRLDGGTGPGDAGFTPGAYYAIAETIIDVFPAKGGLIVVRQHGIDLLADGGAVLKTVASPREITSAASDGTRLAVADRAILTVYDLELNKLVSGYLTESCASSVILGEEFICGPATTWDRNFGTYELAGGSLRATSGNFTYQGTQMVLIPGHAEFFTVGSSSTYLYRVGLTGAVEKYASSGWSSGVQLVGAFDANPASRWIDASGHIYEIYGEGCGSTNNGNCFAQEGELGITTNGTVVGMADDGSGAVFNVVAGEDSWSGKLCTGGCRVQRVDVAERLMTKEVVFAHATAKKVLVTKWDPIRRKLIVGVQIGGSSWEPGTNFELWRFDLE